MRRITSWIIGSPWIGRRRERTMPRICRRSGLNRSVHHLAAGRGQAGNGFARRKIGWSVIALGVLFGAQIAVRGQEAVRMSAAGEAAAEARRRAASTIGYYNLKLGPVGWRFRGGLGVQFNDNIRYRTENTDSDLIFRPQLDTRMVWPLTEKNSLNLSLGFGYSKYLSSSDLDRMFIRPGSELAFDLYVGDFLFNFHDRFSIPMNVYEVPTAGGRGDYQRLENILGVHAFWDLHQFIVSFGYDHLDYVSLNSAFKFADGRSEQFFARGTLTLSPTTSGGVEMGMALINYTDSVLSDGTQYSAGLFYGGQISRYIQLKAMAGYTLYLQEPTGAGSGTSDSGAVYGQLTWTHRLNQMMTYTLAAGRTIHLGLQYGTSQRNLDLTFLRLGWNWTFLRDYRISTPLVFEYGEETGLAAEEFYRFGAGISVGRMVTEKLSAGMGYQFYWKESNRSFGSYTVNTVSLNLGYNF